MSLTARFCEGNFPRPHGSVRPQQIEHVVSEFPMGFAVDRLHRGPERISLFIAELDDVASERFDLRFRHDLFLQRKRPLHYDRFFHGVS